MLYKSLLLVIILALTIITSCINKVSSNYDNNPEPTAEAIVSPTPTPVPTPTAIIPTPAPTSTPTPVPTLIVEDTPVAIIDCLAPNASVFHNTQPPDGRVLVNNNAATDPTWRQLRAFLLLDTTDEKEYIEPSYTCGDFAGDLHDNAEVVGIRAAYVILDLEGRTIGHALNAFCTTDRGLVFIDCTHSNGSESNGIHSWDKVAFVEIGEEYGLSDLDATSCFTYRCYERYKQRRLAYQSNLDDYNNEVEAFNDWVEGQVFIIGTEDHQTAIDWQVSLNATKDALNLEEESLGTYWEPLDRVSNAEIYW